MIAQCERGCRAAEAIICREERNLGCSHGDGRAREGVLLCFPWVALCCSFPFSAPRLGNCEIPLGNSRGDNLAGPCSDSEIISRLCGLRARSLFCVFLWWARFFGAHLCFRNFLGCLRKLGGFPNILWYIWEFVFFKFFVCDSSISYFMNSLRIYWQVNFKSYQSDSPY